MKPPLLIPREHGAYGQLLVPMVTALVLERPTPASLCLAVAAFSAFASHESLLILLGVRGTRAKREQGERARRQGLLWILLASLSAIAGFVLGGKALILAALMPVALLLIFTPIIFRGDEKTLVGELGAAATLSAASLPIAVSAGLEPRHALFVWYVWVIGFATSVSAVRWVISSNKGRRNYAALAAAVIATVVAAALVPQSRIVLSASPYLLASAMLIARPPRTKHIRRVGWTLIACGALTMTLVIVTVRGV